MGSQIPQRDFTNVFRVTGEAEAARSTESLLRSLYEDADREALDPQKIHLRMNAANIDRLGQGQDYLPQEISIKVKRGFVKGRGANRRWRRTPASSR